MADRPTAQLVQANQYNYTYIDPDPQNRLPPPRFGTHLSNIPPKNKKAFMHNVELKFVTPQTPDEFAAHYADFEFLHHFFPFKMTPQELRAVLESRVGACTLVYANFVLIGSFMLDVYKHSVELHGIARPDMFKVIPQHKRVKQYVFSLILDDVFRHMRKDKLIIKAEDYNRGVRGFALMNGFRKLENQDKGRQVWVLSKQRYYERLHKTSKELV
jgi:hypothetical protein